ncbi:MAG: 23S rRNA pseudouridine(2604) synthase RluF [Saprospiraceae bacterium]
MKENNDQSISLNKFISSTGICSRREADQWIKDGRVQLNGAVAKLGNRVEEDDEVLLDGKPLLEKPEQIYIAFNKPIGIVCTTDKKERKNIVDFIGHPERLFPIGRLDKASQGLILLTNDGDIVNKILRAGNKNEKEYIVRVRQRLTPEFIQEMSKGVPILDTVTKRCKVQYINDYTFRIILIQGLNRQIRRMCEHFDYEVATLKRVRVMNIKLGDLKVGEWKELRKRDVDYIQKVLTDASGEADDKIKIKRKIKTQAKRNVPRNTRNNKGKKSGGNYFKDRSKRRKK